MERRGYREYSNRRIWPESQYLPPPGIDSLPFAGIKKSDFLVRTASNGNKNYDVRLMSACAQAVWAVSGVVAALPPAHEAVFDLYFTAGENACHLKRYVNAAVHTIAFLSETSGRVSVSASPIGGLAPLEAVMREIIKYPSLSQKTVFVPLVPNENIYDRINSCQAHLHIDDGAESMTTQAALLYALADDQAEVSGLIDSIKAVRAANGTCMAPQLNQLYRELIDRFNFHNVVTLPFFIKNRRFLELLSGEVCSQNSPWARTQRLILDPAVTTPIKENGPTVGAMMAGYPCRDLGVNLETIQSRGITISQDTIDILHQGNLDQAEFRLLANDRRLLALHPGAEEVIAKIFVQKLGENLQSL